MNRTLAILLLLPLAVHSAKQEEIDKRTVALQEANAKAFEANMALYKDKVMPFLEQHCTKCHGPDKQKGDLDLTQLDPDMKDGNGASRWATVRENLETSEMPPEDEARPTPEELKPVLAWIRAEMKRARRNFARRIQHIHGNQVPHDALFDPQQQAPLAVSPRIRRHSPEIYSAFRGEVAKGFEGQVGNPFTPNPHHVFCGHGCTQGGCAHHFTTAP